MTYRNNKKERQEADRESHKARRKQPDLGRKPETIPQRENILIVCEGENTERSYFEFFRSPTTTMKIVPANKKQGNKKKGTDPMTIVALAIELTKPDEKKLVVKYPDYEVWCVFDADPQPDNIEKLMNFKNAIKKAESFGFKVAYSNQAFEYWLILHFDDDQGNPMHRDFYYDRINDHLKAINPTVVYDKKRKLITEEIFNILQGIDPKTRKSRQTLAIERAEKIYNRPDYNHQNPAEEESSTTVFKLVKKLIGKE